MMPTHQSNASTTALCLPEALWKDTFERYLPKKDLCALSLACRTFSALTRPALFSSVVLSPCMTYVEGNTEQDLEALAQNARCLERIEHITSPHIAPHVRRLVLDQQACPTTDPNVAIEEASLANLPDAMEVLASRVDLLPNVSRVYFGEALVSFKLLELLCGMAREDRPPLEELIIDCAIVRDQVREHCPERQLRIKKVVFSGDIGQNQHHVRVLIHEDTIEILRLSLCVSWDRALHSSYGKQFIYLRRLDLTMEHEDDEIPVSYLRDLLHRCPALEVLVLPKVEFQAASPVEDIATRDDCAHLYTLSAQIHVVRALVPGRTIRNICLLGVPDTYENGSKFIFDAVMGEWVHSASEILEQLDPLEALLSVETLFFLARSLNCDLLLRLWEVFPSLKHLDIRLPTDEDDLCVLEEIAAALMSRHVPMGLKRLTIHGVGLEEDDDNLAEDVREHFVNVSEPRLQHLELVSMESPECLLFNPSNESMQLAITDADDWVPYADFVNLRSWEHLIPPVDA